MMNKKGIKTMVCKNKSRWIGYAVLLAAIMIAGCSKADVKKADDGDSVSPPPPKEPVEIAFHNPSTGNTVESFMEIYGNAIEKKFPHVKVKVLTYKEGHSLDNIMVNKTPLDIFYQSGSALSATFSKYGFQYDISELIQQNKLDLNRFIPEMLQGMRELANGGLYGLPVSAYSMALFYNKDLFDKFGVAYPKDGMTWDELYDLAVKMSRSDQGIQYRGLVYFTTYIGDMNQFSANYVDPKTGKASLNTDNWKKVIDNFARFYHIPGNELTRAQVNNTAALQNFFTKDKITAMKIDQSTTLKYHEDNGLNWDMVSLPTFKELPGIGPQALVLYWNIASTSRHKEQAFEILDFLTSAPFQTNLAENHLVPSVLADKNIQKQYGKNIPFAQKKNVAPSVLPARIASPTYMSEHNAIVAAEFRKAFEDVVVGEKDTNSALREAEERANLAIDRTK